MDPFSIRLQTIIVFVLLMTILPLLGKKAETKDRNILKKRKKEKPFWNQEVVWIIAIFTILSGLRYDLGTDYLGYLRDYTTGVEAAGRGHEFLFHQISKIFYDFKISPIIYFGLWAFIQIFFFLLAFKDDRFIYPFLLFFLFSNGTYDNWMNGIRQDLAACIWIYSVRFIERNNLKAYLLFAVIAYFFHRSSIFLVIFYPLLRNGKDYFESILLQISLFVGAIVLKQFVGSYLTMIDSVFSFYTGIMGGEDYLYEHYTAEEALSQINEHNGGGTGLAVIFKGCIYMLIMAYSKKMKAFYNSKWFVIIYTFFFIGAFFEYLIPDGAINLRRPFRYFVYFLTIMLAYFVNYLFKNRKLNKNYSPIADIVIIGFIGLFFLNRITCSLDEHMMFQFIFQVNDPITHF